MPPTAEKQWQSSPTLLPLLQALLAFLSTALPPLPTSADASGPAKDLSSLLVSPLIPLLVSEHLSLALRSLASPAALPAFAEAASSFAAWERETTSGRSTELAGFAAGVGGTWSKWRRADVLACAREIVGGVVEGDERDDSWLEREAKNGWEGWVWERQTIIPADVEPAAAVEPEPVAPAQAPAAEEADGWSFKDPPAPADVSPVSLPISPPTLVETPDAADDGDDAWGFDDDAAPVSPPPPPLPPAPPVDDEPDAWGFSGSDDDKPIVINKAQPRQAKRLGKAKGKSASVDTTHQPALSPSGSLSSSIAAHAVGALDSGVESGSASRTSSPAPAAAKKGAMKLGKKAALPSSRATPEPESSLDLDVPPQLPSPVRESGPRIVIDRLRISERVKPLFELGREISQEVDELQNLRCVSLSLQARCEAVMLTIHRSSPTASTACPPARPRRRRRCSCARRCRPSSRSSARCCPSLTRRRSSRALRWRCRPSTTASGWPSRCRRCSARRTRRADCCAGPATSGSRTSSCVLLPLLPPLSSSLSLLTATLASPARFAARLASTSSSTARSASSTAGTSSARPTARARSPTSSPGSRSCPSPGRCVSLLW